MQVDTLKIRNSRRFRTKKISDAKCEISLIHIGEWNDALSMLQSSYKIKKKRKSAETNVSTENKRKKNAGIGAEKARPETKKQERKKQRY